jgi:hypothetical protein
LGFARTQLAQTFLAHYNRAIKRVSPDYAACNPAKLVLE